MRLVASPSALAHVTELGGALYLWPRAVRCCGGRTYVLEAATKRPEGELRRADADGIALFLAAGLPEPDEVHLELQRGRLRAYWNDQAWIG